MPMAYRRRSTPGVRAYVRATNPYTLSNSFCSRANLLHRGDEKGKIRCDEPPPRKSGFDRWPNTIYIILQLRAAIELFSFIRGRASLYHRILRINVYTTIAAGHSHYRGGTRSSFNYSSFSSADTQHSTRKKRERIITKEEEEEQEDRFWWNDVQSQTRPGDRTKIH